jgi:hypothetical protein
MSKISHQTATRNGPESGENRRLVVGYFEFGAGGGCFLMSQTNTPQTGTARRISKRQPDNAHAKKPPIAKAFLSLLTPWIRGKSPNNTPTIVPQLDARRSENRRVERTPTTAPRIALNARFCISATFVVYGCVWISSKPHTWSVIPPLPLSALDADAMISFGFQLF